MEALYSAVHFIEEKDFDIETVDENGKVNGQVELQRGKKLRDGDIVSYDGETIKIVK